MEAGELGASRTESERKLSWLASFHQDATLARSDAAILLRSAPPTSSQQSRLQLDFLSFSPPSFLLEPVCSPCDLHTMQWDASRRPHD